MSSRESPTRRRASCSAAASSADLGRVGVVGQPHGSVRADLHRPRLLEPGHGRSGGPQVVDVHRLVGRRQGVRPRPPSPRRPPARCRRRTAAARGPRPARAAVPAPHRPTPAGRAPGSPARPGRCPRAAVYRTCGQPLGEQLAEQPPVAVEVGRGRRPARGRPRRRRRCWPAPRAWRRRGRTGSRPRAQCAASSALDRSSCAALRPGRFQALDADVAVTVCRGGDRRQRGVRAGGRRPGGPAGRGSRRRTPGRRRPSTTSARASCSSTSNTRPSGLCGLTCTSSRPPASKRPVDAVQVVGHPAVALDHRHLDQLAGPARPGRRGTACTPASGGRPGCPAA